MSFWSAWPPRCGPGCCCWAIDPAGHTLTALDFVAPAIRCGRIVDLDLKAVTLALGALGQSPGLIVVNIAPQSVMRPFFQCQLVALLAANPAVAPRLCLEVQEQNLAGDSTQVMATLCRVVAPFGCAVGIDHFGITLTALPVLASPGVRYL